MSLASTMLNGGSIYGGVTVNVSRYGHDTGAMLIATESVEELHDIFLEGFYVAEDAEVQAAMEGVDFESSEYGAVAEAASKSAIQKIKEFFHKLSEKVKSFFHNVKKFFDSIFMSDKDFAKTYKADIEKANKNLKDFTFKMYNYSNDNIDKVVDKGGDVIDGATKMIADVQKVIDGIKDDAAEYNDLDQDTKSKIEKIKSVADDAADLAAKTISGGKVNDYADLDEYFFGYFRGGAGDVEDKDEVDVKDLLSYMNALINDKASKAATTMEANVRKHFNQVFKTINQAEEKMNKVTGKGAASISEALRYLSTIASAYVNVNNKMVTAWKQVISERQTTYKSLLMAGMQNAKKNNGK